MSLDFFQAKGFTKWATPAITCKVNQDQDDLQADSVYRSLGFLFSPPFSMLTFSTYVEMKKSFMEGWEESRQKNEAVLHTLFLDLSSPVGGENDTQWDLTSISVSETH